VLARSIHGDVRMTNVAAGMPVPAQLPSAAAHGG